MINKLYKKYFLNMRCDSWYLSFTSLYRVTQLIFVLIARLSPFPSSSLYTEMSPNFSHPPTQLGKFISQRGTWQVPRGILILAYWSLGLIACIHNFCSPSFFSTFVHIFCLQLCSILFVTFFVQNYTTFGTSITVTVSPRSGSCLATTLVATVSVIFFR